MPIKGEVMPFYLYLVLTLAVAAIHLVRDVRARSAQRVAEVLLQWFLVIFLGMVGVFGFIGHTVFADMVAGSIGWPAGSPFQTEVAVANLAFGVLAICCYWLRGQFWLATVIANAIWLFGDAVVHVYHIIVADNWSPNNAGAALYIDIAIPIILVALLVTARRHAPSRPTNHALQSTR
jgi:uncharacterized protein DUF6790